MITPVSFVLNRFSVKCRVFVVLLLLLLLFICFVLQRFVCLFYHYLYRNSPSAAQDQILKKMLSFNDKHPSAYFYKTIGSNNYLRVLYPSTLFLRTLCIFSKYKATLDKVSYMDLIRNVPRNTKLIVLFQ